jgi:Flp pilus assembly protein TadD
VRKVEKVVAPVAAPVVSAPSSQLKHSSPSCVEAENEAQRAREATSDADRLFYYRRALRLCGESSNYHLETGKAYAAIDRIEDAAFEYRQAIDLDPNNQAAIQQLSILERK